jgi:hypothetical protein
MGIRALNADILKELREVTGDSKIRQKDIMEWCTTPIEPEEGERLAELPKLGMFVAYKPR